MPLGFSFEGEPEVRAARAEIYNNTSDPGWMLLSFSEPKVLRLAAEGSGDAEELAEHFKDDEVQYAFIRIIEEGKNAGRRDHFVTWIGHKVDLRDQDEKTRISSRVSTFFGPHFGDIKVTNRARFTDKNILEMDTASGSRVIE